MAAAAIDGALMMMTMMIMMMMMMMPLQTNGKRTDDGEDDADDDDDDDTDGRDDDGDDDTFANQGGHAGSEAPLLFVSYQDLTPIRRLPPIEDAPGPTACAAADVHVVSSHVTQATVFRLHRNSPVSHFRSTSNCPKGRCREERCAAS